MRRSRELLRLRQLSGDRRPPDEMRPPRHRGDLPAERRPVTHRSVLEAARGPHPLCDHTLADALARMAAKERGRDSYATAAAACELASVLTTDPATRARRRHS